METKILNNKKGEMLARDWVIAIIIFGTIVGLAFLFVGDISSSDNGYNTSISNPSIESHYDTLTNISDDVYTAQNATASGEGLSTTSTFTIVFKATFSVISIVFGSFSIVNQVFISFAQDFGVPAAVANVFFGGIIVVAITIIIFVVISSVSQGKL